MGFVRNNFRLSATLINPPSITLEVDDLRRALAAFLEAMRKRHQQSSAKLPEGDFAVAGQIDSDEVRRVACLVCSATVSTQVATVLLRFDAAGHEDFIGEELCKEFGDMSAWPAAGLFTQATLAVDATGQVGTLRRMALCCHGALSTQTNSARVELGRR